MKHFLFFLIIVYCITAKTGSAQSWTIVNPKPSPTNINGVTFVNADTGYIACGENNIYRTHNGGSTWEPFHTTVAGYFQSITSVSNGNGFIIGHNKSIGRTTNYGETWDFLTGPGESTYRNIKFSDPLHGWICGWYRTLLRTQDGGNSWQLLSQNVWDDMNYLCVDFLNKDTGYLAGAQGIQYPHGRLLRTFNGGVTVEEIAIPLESEEISDVEAVSYNEIWLAESRHIGNHALLYHSTDAGLTWITVPIGINGSADDIEFITPLKGRVIGDNYCYQTEDGGVSWDQKLILTSGYAPFISSSWVNDSVAYASGYNGSIAKTLNSGNKWKDLSQGSHAALSDIEFFDSQKGIAVGAEQGYEFIYNTFDGGNTWTSTLNSSNNGWIFKTTYASENEVWASGSQNRIFHSTNSGNSWTTMHPSENSTDFYFSICPTGNGRIYAGGNTLIYSDDQGQTWLKNGFDCPGYAIRNIIFTDPSNGFLILWESTSSPMYSKMFSTHDAGSSWNEITYSVDPANKILAADFLNKDTGLISIYQTGFARTTDGGQSWVCEGFPNNMMFFYLKMFDANKAVAVSFYGDVFYSYNGGISWAAQQLTDSPEPEVSISDFMGINYTGQSRAPEGMDGFRGIFFNNMGEGWLCGDQGLIQKYSFLTVGLQEALPVQPYHYRISPNPATDYIKITGDVDPDQVLVYNSQGRLVLQPGGSLVGFDVSKLASGIYVLQIVKNRQSVSLKFLKR